MTLSDRRLAQAIQETDAGLFVLDPIQAYLGDGVDMHRANEVRPIFKRLGQLAEQMRKFSDLSQTPIILVSQVIRGYFSKMITQFYPNVYVLSFNEITSNVQIQALGNITLDTPARDRRAVGT